MAQDLGAKAVVASLWPVADEATEVLMREFYQLKGANPRWSKAEALRQAQIALLKGKEMTKRPSEERRGIVNEIEGGMNAYKRDAKARFGDPHYWAPFILIGNWKCSMTGTANPPRSESVRRSLIRTHQWASH